MSCLVPDPPWLGQEDGGQEYEHPVEEVAGVVGNGHWIGWFVSEKWTPRRRIPPEGGRGGDKGGRRPS